MGTPGETTRDLKAKEAAILELISAQSALNMESCPIPLPPDHEEPAFLTDTEEWVAHAAEHIHEAIRRLMHG